LCSSFLQQYLISGTNIGFFIRNEKNKTYTQSNNTITTTHELKKENPKKKRRKKEKKKVEGLLPNA
jgi:hypothetical protein